MKIKKYEKEKGSIIYIKINDIFSIQLRKNRIIDTQAFLIKIMEKPFDVLNTCIIKRKKSITKIMIKIYTYI